MTANAFNEILDRIRGSNLNYQIQLSPFSAYISLKNTLIKDKRGFQVLPQSTPFPSKDVKNNDIVEILTAKNQKLENDLSALQSTLDKVVKDVEESHRTLKSRDSEIDNLKNKLEEVLADKFVVEKENSDDDRKKKKTLKKSRQKAEKSEKVAMVEPEDKKKTDSEYSQQSAVATPVRSFRHLDSSTSPRTPPGLPPPGPSRASNSVLTPSEEQTSSSQSASFQTHRTVEDEDISENVEEEVLFEGKLISKQDAFKKILEAVQDMNNHFNPA